MTNATSTPPWQPTDLPTLRAAYSDRTAALMAYLASFAYSDSIGAKGRITVPPELAALGFSHITAFHNNLTDGWAYLAESEMLIVLAFRGTRSPLNWRTNFHAWLVHPANPRLLVYQGFYDAFEKLSDGTQGIRQKMAEVQAATSGVLLNE